MSDMEVREIKSPAALLCVPKVIADPVAELLESYAKPAKAKKPRSGEIIFEGPSEKETKAAELEKATPLVDVAGRSRWIMTRECYCDYNSKSECRFHSVHEKGWEKCPNTPNTTAPYKPARKLWATNPEFGKPRDVYAVLAEVANEVEVEVAA